MFSSILVVKTIYASLHSLEQNKIKIWIGNTNVMEILDLASGNWIGEKG